MGYLFVSGHRQKHDWDYVTAGIPVIKPNPKLLSMSVMGTGVPLLPNSKGLRLARAMHPDEDGEAGEAEEELMIGDWEVFTDSKSKRKYYHNRVTGETSWKRPLI